MKEKMNLTIGNSKKIKVNGLYIVNKKFKSSKKQIAQVSKKGKVTAKKVGQCKITITVKYKKTKKAKKFNVKKFICKVRIKAINSNFEPPSKTHTSVRTRKPTITPTLAPTGKPTIRPCLLPTASPTIAPTSTPTAAPTPIIDKNIHNPEVENNTSTWDLVEYGRYPQSSYTPIDRPDNPQDNKTYVDSDGTVFLCRKSVRYISNTVLNEETQKYEEIYTTETNYYYYKYEPILWRVININDNDAFLVADKCLDYMQYNSRHEDTSWEKCSLRTWLNNAFKNMAFSENEQMSIINTYVYNRGNPQSLSTYAGGNTNDDLFLLDIYEVSKEEYGFDVDKDINNKDGYGNFKSETRIASHTDYAADGGTGRFFPGAKTNTDWWLRSPTDSTYEAATVFQFGSINYGIKGLSGDSVGYFNEVRPATHIDISKFPPKKVGVVKSNGQYILFNYSK